MVDIQEVKIIPKMKPSVLRNALLRMATGSLYQVDLFGLSMAILYESCLIS